MSFASLVCFALAAAIAVWVGMVWRGVSQDWLPEDLKAGRLVNVEEDLTTDEPYAVVGRPDQVYRLATGLHVPVELKNRDKHTVYETDIAEISLRAWLLRMNGKPTAEHGYMAINSRGTGKRVAMKVDLRDDAFCEALIQRHIALIQGQAVPRKSRGAKCKSCGHLARCQPR